jgi:hypothetical protein
VSHNNRESVLSFFFPFAVSLFSSPPFTAAGPAFLGAPSLRRDGAGGGRGRGRGRRVAAVAVAVGAAAVEAALEGACVRGRRAHALGRGAVAVAVGGRRAPPQRLGRRRRAGRRRAVVVAVEPAFLRPGVHVVGRHQHCTSTSSTGSNEQKVLIKS